MRNNVEFDTKPVPENDEARHLAETKKLTLQPLHDDIMPEAPRGSEIVAHHLASPAISNSTNDIEQNASLIQPSKEILHASAPLVAHKNSRSFPFVVTLLITFLIGIGAYFISIK